MSMIILDSHFEIANFTNEEVVRLGYALTGGALAEFSDRAGQPKLEKVIDDLESDLHLCQEQKEELSEANQDLQDENNDLKRQLNELEEKYWKLRNKES